MNQVVQMQDAPSPRSVVASMAHRYSMEAGPFEQTLRATVVPDNCSKEQFAAFLLVAREHNLNPVTKEIYAFPTRGGGIQPIVSVDGWMNIINSHPQFDGMEFKDHLDNGKLTAITCRMYRKDRSHPTEVTEYLSECKRSTDTWKTWPARMLRHKSAIQCARYAFGFSGIVDEDEFARAESVTKDITPPAPPPPPAVDKGGEIPPIATEAAKEPEPPTIDAEAEPIEEGVDLADYDGFIADLEVRLKEADFDTQAEIWSSEVEIKIEDGQIFPPDIARLKGLIKEA